MRIKLKWAAGLEFEQQSRSTVNARNVTLFNEIAKALLTLEPY